MDAVVLMTVVLVMLFATSVVCANGDWRWVLRTTLVPRSSREFWLPPCPICWAVRGMAAVIVIKLAFEVA